MVLFAYSKNDINVKETKKNVQRFFMNDYQRLMNISKAPTLSSVAYGTERVSKSIENNVERKTIEQVQAKYYLECIQNALNSLDDNERSLIKLKLINHLTIDTIMDRMGYGQTRIYEIYSNACLNFAITLSDTTDINLVKLSKP